MTMPSRGASGSTKRVGTTTLMPAPGSQGSTPGLARVISSYPTLKRRAISGSVSSFEAIVICTAPTTSSSVLASVNLWVSTGGASVGAGGGGAASTTAAGLGSGGEPIRAQLASAARAALPATANAPRQAHAQGFGR